MALHARKKYHTIDNCDKLNLIKSQDKTSRKWYEYKEIINLEMRQNLKPGKAMYILASTIAE